MAIPAYVNNSTAVSSTADACTLIATSTITYPASISAGNILLAIFNANTISTADAVGGLSGWSIVYENGAGTTRYVGVYYKVATGSESGTIDITMSYSGASGSRFLAVIYNFSAGSVDNTIGAANSGLSSVPAFASTTTNAANTCCVGVMWANTSTTINSHTGETGGDWTEAVAEHTSAGNLIQVQTAAMVSTGTISGGNSSLGVSTTWRNYTFGIEEVVAGAIANKVIGSNFAVKRANFF